jgi:hypothetical protein
MLHPPQRFRHIKENLTISGPLKSENIDYLSEVGCHKIMGLSGLNVDSLVLAKIKSKMMQFEIYTLMIDSLEERLFVEQLDRALKQVRYHLKKGSRLHIACGHDMAQIASLVGVMRQMDDDWSPAAAAAEALEVCRYSDSDLVLDIVCNSPQKLS